MAYDDCPSPERLTLYLDDRLDGDERTRLEAHLSRCRSCRSRVVEAYEARREPPEVAVPEDLVARARSLPHGAVRPSSARRWWTAAAAAVVAALGLGVILWHGRLEPTPAGETLRRSSSPAIELLSPANGARVASGPIVFDWSDVPGRRRSTLRVVDALGNQVYQVDTPGSRLEVDADVFADRGEVFWYVVLTLDDGASLESEVRRLEVMPAAPGEEAR